MLIDDRRLPFLARCWSEPEMTAFFNEHVLPLLAPGQRVRAVEISKVYYEPTRSACILYLLSFAAPASSLSPWASVTVLADEPPAARLPDDNSVSGTAPLTLCLSEPRCLVEFFPADQELPGLRPATDALQVAGLLGGDASAALRIDVLRYLPHRRCVLRYGRSGGPDVVGKLFPSARAADEAWCALQALRPQAAALGLLLPEPLRLQRDWNLLLMEFVRGQPWDKALKRHAGERAADAGIDQAAGLLSGFHTLELACDTLRDLPSDWARTLERVQGVAAIDAAFGEQAAAILERLRPLPEAGPEASRALLHGDFAPSQMMVSDGRLALVDLDTVCRGDPALDVASFMAKLHRRAIAKGDPRFRALAQRFLAAYAGLRPECRVEERVQPLLVVRLVRMAVDSYRRAPCRAADAGSTSRAAELLEEAAACVPSA